MKICAITMVRNEADVIESFIRYGLSHYDQMVVLDNGSTDNTPLILNKIIEEGKNIEVIHFPSSGKELGLFINELFSYAIKKYEPDFIVPIDADEFLEAKGNPRDVISTLSPKYVYIIPWRTYVPIVMPEYPEFVLKLMTHYRDIRYEKYTKVIIPTQLAKQYPLTINVGNHDVAGIDPTLVKTLNGVWMGHFPIRSQEQFRSKIIAGVVRHMCKIRHAGAGGHLLAPYERIKNGETVDLFSEAMNFANFTGKPFTLYYSAKFNTDFCSDTRLHYPELAQVSYLKNTLNMAEQMAHTLQSIYMQFPLEAAEDGEMSLRNLLKKRRPGQR